MMMIHEEQNLQPSRYHSNRDRDVRDQRSGASLLTPDLDMRPLSFQNFSGATAQRQKTSSSNALPELIVPIAIQLTSTQKWHERLAVDHAQDARANSLQFSQARTPSGATIKKRCWPKVVDHDCSPFNGQVNIVRRPRC